MTVKGTSLTDQLDNTPTNSFYAHYVVLFQSSGTGKSRLVDELAKEILLIPICIRGVSTGYPPTDAEVRRYLTDGKTRITIHRVEGFKGLDYSKTATTFRRKMTDGMKKEHNGFRRSFFDHVVRSAESYLQNITLKLEARNDTKGIESRHLTPPKGRLATGGEDAHEAEPKEKAEESIDSELLQDLLNAWTALDAVLKDRIDPSQDTKAPRLLISFDEAHELTVVQNPTKNDTWSPFAELRATLRALNNCSVFSIFLSTTGTLSQFTPPIRKDISSRVYTHTLKLIPPFCDTGMDLLAINEAEDRKVNLSGDWRLQDVVTDEFMTSLGRPLFGLMYRQGNQSVQTTLLEFAKQKLTNHHAGTPVEMDMEQATACLGFRLPFEFLSTTYIGQDTEFKQVEGHLRICLKPHVESESMVTISPSEPFVSQAAAALLHNTKWKGTNENIESIQVLKNLMTGFSIHAGDRGEFVALLLLTLARDKAANPRIAPLSDFIRRLLVTDKLETLCKDFPCAMMHFNHFIRPHQQKIIHRDMLLLLMARGAGVLCAPNTPKIDIILPFLIDGNGIKPTNVGAILCQVKNEKTYTETPKPKLFEEMDPYDIKFLPEGAPAVPLIKVFMALASAHSAVDIVRHEPTEAYNAVVYDIWIAGLSSDVYAPITETNQSIWTAALAATRSWESIYSVPRQAPEMRAVRQSSHPGAADSPNHWSWASVEDIRDCLENAKGAASTAAGGGQRQSKRPTSRATKRTKR
ncbi:hypothetical protein EYR36_001976 [Pleurotus pulmonarius]|nr:hypothetical protein EYR36_001976 [Pleurotus pulmonarius]